MKKYIDWVLAHKVKAGLIILGLFVIPLLVIHLLYKWQTPHFLFQSSWSSGELITYIAGFETFLGTVFLGTVAAHQNEKASDLNERMLKNAEVRDRFERRPINSISDCKCEIISESELQKKPPISDSMIYFESVPYTSTSDYNLNKKHILLSFTISSLSNFPYTFILKNVEFACLVKTGSSQTIDFRLRHPNNTSSTLLPNQSQNVIFKAREDSLKEKYSYILTFQFTHTNILGEEFNEDYKFLFKSPNYNKSELVYIGSNSI